MNDEDVPEEEGERRRGSASTYQLALLQVLLPGQHHVVEAETVLDEQYEEGREREQERLGHEDVPSPARRRVEPTESVIDRHDADPRARRDCLLHVHVERSL